MSAVIDKLNDTFEKLEAATPEQKAEIAALLVKLSRVIASAGAKFYTVPQECKESLLPDINAQLSSVDKRTEVATEGILSACESLSSLARNLPEDLRRTMEEQINVIFESCNFQDLVAQHVNEARLRLEALTHTIEDLHAAMEQTFGSKTAQDQSQQTPIKRVRSPLEERPDRHLLNGPAVVA